MLWRALVAIILGTFAWPPIAAAQLLEPNSYGPYNGVFREGGSGLSKPVEPGDPVLQATAQWSLYCWFRSEMSPGDSTLLAGVGDPRDEYSRYLGIRDGKLIFWMGADNGLAASAPLTSAEWHFAAITFDGATAHLFADGQESASGNLTLGRVAPTLQMSPDGLPWSSAKHFGGKIAGLTLLRRVLSSTEIKQLSTHAPNASLIEFEEGSKPWPLQTKDQAGYRAPQDPASLPRSVAPFSPPAIETLSAAATTLAASGENRWILGNWKLTPAPRTIPSEAAISQVGFDARDWWTATVPGTVLTTMVNRGVYPDPDYGLNNLAIPEQLNKQDYWYRTEFTAPKSADGHHLTLTFNGINYAAAVWLNGKRLGDIKGAFIRGNFDVTGLVKANSANALAVRVSPPPHPGIPHEQSIKAGPGENGGMMVLDGPTFMATEGWDWIPSIRDRNTGIWQDVVLSASGEVAIGDPQVVTTLPLPDTSRADVEIDIPLRNLSSSAVEGNITAAFGDITVTRKITVQPGEVTVKLTPMEFPQLTVQHPRLWWPNGYGKPELYTLKLSFVSNDRASDTKELNFGIREITYELSLYDSAGHLRRVEFSPSVARQKSERVVDVSHATDFSRLGILVNPWSGEFRRDQGAAGLRRGAGFHRYGDQGEWGKNRLQGRQLGDGRFSQAGFPGTP
jgi:hypothetical protein